MPNNKPVEQLTGGYLLFQLIDIVHLFVAYLIKVYFHLIKCINQLTMSNLLRTKNTSGERGPTVNVKMELR